MDGLEQEGRASSPEFVRMGSFRGYKFKKSRI